MSDRTEDDGPQYWAAVHDETSEDLSAVCFPDHPVWFNRFYDRIQRYAIDGYLRREHVSLVGKSTLDVGCGRGRWLRHFSGQHGARVTGIDLAPSAVEACRRQGFDVHRASVGDLEPIGDGSIDLVTSITVLMHVSLDEKQAAAAEFARVLTSGGRLLVIESTWDDPAPHVHGIPVGEWEALMADAGLQLAYAEGHCFNLVRRRAPAWLPARDRVTITFDYPLEFALMRRLRGRRSSRGLQHLMVFTPC